MTRSRGRRVPAILAWAVLCLAGCGHYGPPIRSQPAPATAPAGPADPAAPAPEEETRRDAP